MPSPKRSLEETMAIKSAEAIQENARQRQIAYNYLSDGPNIINLAKAAYHYYNGVPWLGGRNESGLTINKGDVPTPGMRNPKAIVQSIKTITKANASKITPAQWTAAQDAAIARGDITEAQRLRDLHFNISAPNSKLKGVYQHGTNEKNIKSFKDKEITEFNKNLEWVYNKDLNDFIREGYNISPEQIKAYNNGKTIVLSENPIATYFSNTKQMANTYRPNYLYRPGRGGKRYAVKINAPTLKTINGNNSNWNRILTSDNVTQTTRDIESDYRHIVDAVKIKSISDAGKYGEYGEPVIGDVIINYNPKNIKSAQAVTYDDNGVRIPLGERDNFNINDIRYALTPFIAGGIGYGAYNRVKKRNGGTIHIAPSKRGTFTAAASRRGLGVQAFASRVLANKESYSPAMVKKANFARNASKWNH